MNFNFKFLSADKINFNEIRLATREWLVSTYAQAESVFTRSSPFGQILNVIEEFIQLIFLYIEDALVELNIFTASKTRSIYNWARLTGHDPTLSISSQGTLGLQIKPAAEKPLNASYIIILNKTKITCLANAKKYFVHTGNSVGNLKIDLKSNELFPIKIIQGEIENQTLIGTGEELQSYNVTSNGEIENEMIWISINGQEYEIVDSLYDMKKGDIACLVKTSLTKGIDIYFGNEDYGTIPPEGSTIDVMYVKTDGFEGNIFSKSREIEFKFNEPGFTNTGEEADLNEIFNISIVKPIILGADSEDENLTKLIAPKASRSYVLASTDNYVNFLSRFNYSYVDAYTTVEDEYIDDDNVIYLFLIPDISRRLITNTDYFKTNLTNFYLDEDEKNAVIEFIDMSGRQVISTELQIVDPILTKYVLNIYVRIFDSVDQNIIKGEIVNKITDYLLKVKRRDKIPKSDIIAILENIKGIDSVNLSFVSEINEKAINEGYYIQRVNTIDRIRGLTVVTENKINLKENEDPNIGLDEFGDIKIGLNEMPVIRGGFYDRFNNYYEDGINYNEYSSVNIIVKDVIKESLTIKMMNANKNTVKNA